MDKKNGRPSLDIPSTDYSRARLNSNGVSPPQSPGAESQLSFSSTAPIYDPRRATVTSLGGAPSEVNSFKIVSEELGRGRMRTWESKKVRRLSACLVFFVVAAVVISALFVWREVVNRHRQMESKSTENPPEVSLSHRLNALAASLAIHRNFSSADKAICIPQYFLPRIKTSTKKKVTKPHLSLWRLNQLQVTFESSAMVHPSHDPGALIPLYLPPSSFLICEVITHCHQSVEWRVWHW